MFTQNTTCEDFIFLTQDEQIQLKIVNNIVTEAKEAGKKTCTWYNLKENVVKQLEQFGYKVTSETYPSFELFTIHLPND